MKIQWLLRHAKIEAALPLKIAIEIRCERKAASHLSPVSVSSRLLISRRNLSVVGPQLQQHDYIMSIEFSKCEACQDCLVAWSH
jgi:hypothetical protein